MIAYDDGTTYVRVYWSIASTPEEHYWTERLRALEDDGRWMPERSASADLRAIDRAILLGPPTTKGTR